LNIRTVIILRLQHEGQLIGSLNVFAFEPRVFLVEELMLLKGIAAEAALAIANARLYHALQQQERARALLLRQVITAQEDERMRIARELHDETGQSLSALILGLDVARLIVREDIQKADAHLQDIQEIAKGLLQNTRRLVADLRPSLLDDLGLVPAIAWYGEQRLNPIGIQLHLQEEGLQMRLPRAMETALFRIVQEALTNVARHAQATEVSVTWNCQENAITLKIADNGRGFDPLLLRSDDIEGKGLGLRGMQERVEILGGQFSLQAAPGQGTCIVVWVPISQFEESHVQG
jgi:signal transduction histidine kinase